VDIWSFGMTVLEMATLDFPFSECSGIGVIYKKLQNGELPRSIAKIVDQDLLSFISYCLSPANERPTAEQLLHHPLFEESQDDSSEVVLLSEQETEELFIKIGDKWDDYLKKFREMYPLPSTVEEEEDRLDDDSSSTVIIESDSDVDIDLEDDLSSSIDQIYEDNDNQNCDFSVEESNSDEIIEEDYITQKNNTLHSSDNDTIQITIDIKNIKFNTNYLYNLKTGSPKVSEQLEFLKIPEKYHSIIMKLFKTQIEPFKSKDDFMLDDIVLHYTMPGSQKDQITLGISKQLTDKN
jgi:serine/threonine protein kinase